MVGYLGKRTNWQRDAIGQQTQTERESQWGPMDGEVVDYDAAAGTATVKPLYKPLHNGEPVDMPDLYEVPIEMPRTANGGMTFPIPAGTKVRLTPSMRSTEKYDDEGDGAPSDARSFHLSDMRASITGGDSLKDPLQNVDADNFHLRFNNDGSFGLKGSPDGKFELKGAQGEFFDLVATVVEQTQSGFQYLSTEPALIYTGQYAAIAAELEQIATKLRAMIV